MKDVLIHTYLFKRTGCVRKPLSQPKTLMIETLMTVENIELVDYNVNHVLFAGEKDNLFILFFWPTTNFQ